MAPEAQKRSSLKDSAVFFGQMARQPRKVASVIPSSRALARAIVAGIDPAKGNVIEYGGGTGKVTEAILAKGVAPENLVVFEINETFVSLLEERFPKVRILPWMAQRVTETPIDNVSTIVSGLPLLAMPQEVQRDILKNSFEKLEPGGEYVQFTYGTRPPVSADIYAPLGLSVEKRTRVFWNLPPASVFVFRRKG